MKRGAYVSIIVFLTFLLKYLLSPEDVQEGLRHTRRGLSFNQLIFFSVILFVGCICFIISTKLVLKLIISDADKTLTVSFIDRFRIKSKTVAVHLSQVQISKHIYEDSRRGQGLSHEHYSLTLTNKEFGTLNITSLEFPEIVGIVNYFETMKLMTAARMRQKRLAKKRFRR